MAGPKINIVSNIPDLNSGEPINNPRVGVYKPGSGLKDSVQIGVVSNELDPYIIAIALCPQGLTKSFSPTLSALDKGQKPTSEGLEYIVVDTREGRLVMTDTPPTPYTRLEGWAVYQETAVRFYPYPQQGSDQGPAHIQLPPGNITHLVLALNSNSSRKEEKFIVPSGTDTLKYVVEALQITKYGGVHIKLQQDQEKTKTSPGVGIRETRQSASRTNRRQKPQQRIPFLAKALGGLSALALMVAIVGPQIRGLIPLQPSSAATGTEWGLCTVTGADEGLKKTKRLELSSEQVGSLFNNATFAYIRGSKRLDPSDPEGKRERVETKDGYYVTVRNKNGTYCRELQNGQQ